MNEKRQTKLLLLILVALICFFALVNIFISENRKKSVVVKDDGAYYSYDIDLCLYEDDYLFLSGWFLELSSYRNQIRKDANTNYNVSLLLVDEDSISESDEPIPGIMSEMDYCSRLDVNSYFECEFDYSSSGFLAKFESKRINKEKIYHIFFKRNINDAEAIKSSFYLYNEKLYRVNPHDIKELDVENTDIEQIVYDGTLLVSRPRDGIFVYQYNNKIYWIMDDYKFSDDNSTYIWCRTETTQFSKLPEYSLNNGLFWGENGKIFEQNELTNEINCGKYRVSCCEIPNEYSVSYITTGYYSNAKWIWQSFFRPDYSVLLNK